MRSLFLIIAAVAVAAVGYFFYTGGNVDDVVEGAQETATDAADAATETATDAADAAGDAASDAADAATEAGFSVDKKQIALAAPIKELGLHVVHVVLHPEVDVEITLNVARSTEIGRASRRERV